MDRRSLLALLASLSTLPSGGGCRRSEREDGRVVVSLWFSYGGKNREVLLDLVGRFNRTQDKVLVKAVFQGDYYEALAKLRTAIAAGAAPTLSHVVVEVLPYLARAGVLEPLDRYEGASELRLVPELAQAKAFRGGAEHPLVGIPFNRSIPVAYLNGRLFREAGVAAPKTWADLVEAARRFTLRSGERTVRFGYGVPLSWWFWVAMVGQAGGEIVDERGNVTFGGAAGEAALRFWQDLVHRERVMRLPPGRDYNAWQATNQDFLAERVAMTWMSTAFMRYLEENAGFPVVVAPLPRREKAAIPTGGTLFIVPAAAPEANKQAAWAFLRFMCEPEQAIEWSTRTGYLPVTEPAVERMRASGFYAKHPNDLVAQRALADVEPWPWAPNLLEIQRDILEPRLEHAVIHDIDAARLLAEARELARRP